MSILVGKRGWQRYPWGARKSGGPKWEDICHSMEHAFKQADYERGVVSGIQAVTQHLMQHFPASGAGPNELPNKAVTL